MRRLWFGLVTVVGGAALVQACTPQEEDEVAVAFKASFKVEPTATTEVVFPFADDGLADIIAQGLVVSDGGTAEVKDTAEGRGLVLSGKGEVQATFSASKLEALGKDKGIPQTSVTRVVPDGGTTIVYVRVTKTGTSLAPIEFSYQVSKDCGSECGGKRKYSYSGQASQGLNKVTLSFSEEATPK